ncbi:hypothetical protein FRC01_008169 [Tulasnella sp. 417]|nr:hypothetical protein FRC01_008169 [Tulasnella sp. 417]
MRRMPRFKADAEAGKLGSPPLLEILKKVKPYRWCSGHMHTKFEATFKHEGSAAAAETSSRGTTVEASSSIQPDVVDNEEQSKPVPRSSPSQPAPSTSQSRPGASETEFLGLDQCLPKRDYLEIIDFPAPLTNDPPRLTFDVEWLGIVRATHQYFSRTKTQHPLPPDNVLRLRIAENIRWVKENVGESKDITEIQAFATTSPGPDPAFVGDSYPQPISYTNPQTVAFCEMLGIPNEID